MKNKILLILSALAASVLVAVPVSGSTLFSHYAQNGLKLPSVHERALFAAQNGIPFYKGTLKQNSDLLSILENSIGSFSVATGFQKTLRVPMSATQSTVPVSSFGLKDGSTLTMAALGDKVFLDIDPGGLKEEVVVCTGIDGVALNFTGCTRGLAFSGTSTVSNASIAYPHNASTPVVMSNVHYVYEQFVDVNNKTQTISGQKTFDTIPYIPTSTPTDQRSAVSLYQFQQATTTGGINGSETVKGVWQGSTADQAAAGTSLGSTGARLALPGSLASSAPNVTTTDQSAVGTNLGLIIGSNTNSSYAQQFLPTIRTLSGIIFRKVDIVGNPTYDFVVSLQSNSNNLPSGNTLSSYTIPVATFAGYPNASEVFVPLSSNLIVDGSTKYWIIITRSGIDPAGNYTDISASFSSIYANGISARSNNSSTTLAWTTTSTANDLYFKTIYYTGSVIPVTVSSTGILDSHFGGFPNSLATLNTSTLVVQNPASATSTPTASSIVMSGASSTINNGFIDSRSINVQTLIAGESIDASSTPLALYLQTDGRVYKTTSASASTTIFGFIGFAVLGQTVTVGQNINVQVAGVVTGFTGLTSSSLMYVNGTAGQVSSTSATVSYSIGKSIDTTTLLIQKGKKVMSGTITYTSTTSTIVTTGFKPSKITFNASSQSSISYYTGYSNGVWDSTSGSHYTSITVGTNATAGAGLGAYSATSGGTGGTGDVTNISTTSFTITNTQTGTGNVYVVYQAEE